MPGKLNENSTIDAPGMKMPVIGFGTWQIPGQDIEQAIDTALETGYRHFDAAYAYMNEAGIGRALKKWLDSGKIKREELFIATKLPFIANNPKYVEECIIKSLNDLQLSYVDLYMIHNPVGLVYGEGIFPRDENGKLKLDMSTDLVAIWKAMEEQVDAKRAKAIGISNFNIRQTERILKSARIPPVNNQVEMHIYLQQKELLEFSKMSGVTVCAYSPLGTPNFINFAKKVGGNADGVRDLKPLTEPVAQKIAKAHGKTTAQVLLRYLIQLGVAVIPKSVTPNRIKENFQSPKQEVEQAIDAALEAGYRHIDTAFLYMNEAAIGKTLKKWFDSGKIKREELFIVTKLPMTGNNPKYVEEFIKKSLEALQLSYLDLYLIHNPVGIVYGEEVFPVDENGKLKLDMTTDHVAIWKAMEAQVDAGRTKAIGVSNFNIRQIERILKSARIPPANNQVEMHLYMQQKELRDFSKKSGVTVCAYSPLGSPNLKNFVSSHGGNADDIKDLSPLTDPVVMKIAEARGKTPAQILLRHLIQLGVAVIPKSVTPSRIKANYQIFDFELTSSEMAELNALDLGEEGRILVGGIVTEFQRHPEYPFPKADVKD